MSMKRGDYARSKVGNGNVARSKRQPFNHGFKPGSKRTGAGTSCKPPKGK